MRIFERPEATEYHEFYARYLDEVDFDNFEQQFESQPGYLGKLLGNAPIEELTRLHEPYTWTLKQVVGHLIDGERIFSNRMVRIAVGDDTPIPGIDQKMFVQSVDFNSLSVESLLEEFACLRRANVLAAQKYSDSSLANMGIAADTPVSARANLFILVGHVAYHTKIIDKRLRK